jgi:cytochrome c oxidase assembly factor CtaG
MRRAGWPALALAALPAAALAHAGGYDPGPPRWSLEPWVVAPIAAALVFFTLGWVRLHARAGQGGPRLRRQALFFYGGMAILALAVISPLHDAGRRSFTAHMAEHELMMLVAAPLLVLSRPLAVMLWAFPTGGRQALAGLARQRTLAGSWRGLHDPALATLLQAAALWLWHAPALFDRALQSEGWHIFQHVSFMVAALVFWSSMLDRRRGVGQAVVGLFATSLVSGALGAFMAVSQSPWYQGYADLGLTPYGLTPAEDQQLAGVLMWVPGGLVHAIAALALLAPLLRSRPGGADARTS